MYRAIFLPAIILTFFLAAFPAQAENRIMIVLDASASMASPGSTRTGSTKLEEVATALNALFQKLPTDIAIGLRVMGGAPSSDCYSSYLYVQPMTGMRSILQDQIDTIIPSGSRALYQAIEDGLNDLADPGSGTGETSLLVITDGGDGCDRDLGLLVPNYVYDRNKPRIVIYGLDLTIADRDKIGEFAGAVDGRLVTLQSVGALAGALGSFADGFSSNTRIHLQNSMGVGVDGDLTIVNVNTGTVVAESLDSTDFSTTLPPGTYEIHARYLGQEVVSDQFTVAGAGGADISLTFLENLGLFILSLKDLYGNGLRARVTFINSAGIRILTTEMDANHRVEIPPDIYTLEISIGDRIETVYGVTVGPGQPATREIKIDIEMAVLEAEITNYDGEPVNADVKILDSDGTIVDEAPYSSYLYSHLPPGQYEVVAEVNGIEGSQIVYLYEGDQTQVGVELDIPLGDLFIKLRTETGNEVWGWVTIYDANGNRLERFNPESAESPEWNITGLVVGFYRIEAESNDIVRVVDDVEVRANQEIEIIITFPDSVM